MRGGAPGLPWGYLVSHKRHRRQRARACVSRSRVGPRPAITFRPQSHRRAALLTGTALATTLLLVALVAPTPAIAVVGDCDDAGPDAVSITSATPIVCINTEVRNDPTVGYAISLDTTADGASITVNNSGDLTVAPVTGDAYGIYAYTREDYSPINIVNSGEIRATSNDGDAHGIYATTLDDNSSISIKNASRIAATGSYSALGISAITFDDDSNISIKNASRIDATGSDSALGIDAITFDDNSSISIVNRGDIDARADLFAFGIRAATLDSGSPISITNSGNVTARSYFAAGIVAETGSSGSPISIVNSGSVTSLGIIAADGIGGDTCGSSIEIANRGNVTASALGTARGIVGYCGGSGGVSIHNSGRITAAGQNAFGIFAATFYPNGQLNIFNSGDITATAQMPSYCYCGFAAYGIFGITTAGSISITNTGSVKALGPDSAGVAAISRYGSPIVVNNAGSIYGGRVGIYAYNPYGTTKIVNTGDISAGSMLAISVVYGPATIFNTGTITGFVLLDADDNFINQAGGTFEARQTSDFDAYGPGGNDLFRNEAGAVVHTADDITRSETTRFVNLERFENQGLISLVDNRPGDNFTISNTPGGTDLKFAASGNSRLAVDAFLGGPSNSRSDTFTIEGDVSGVTTVQVVNTNYGPGVVQPFGHARGDRDRRDAEPGRLQAGRVHRHRLLQLRSVLHADGIGLLGIAQLRRARRLPAAAARDRGPGHLASERLDLVRPHRRSACVDGGWACADRLRSRRQVARGCRTVSADAGGVGAGLRELARPGRHGAHHRLWTRL